MPRRNFATIARHVLGAKYDLSLATIDRPEAQRLNKQYRGRDKATNILSFPLAPDVGEILLCLPLIRAEAVANGKKFTDYCRYLFIHGLLHLKGFVHGSKMEAEEKRLDAFFDHHEQTHRHRPRHRHRGRADRGLRTRRGK
ncbi:MAG: rRNA maturation RNase YbeY [Patescibacteria group bacterium]